MAELTTTSYLILGMLTRSDRSAYDLAQQMSLGLSQLWPRAERQMYNAPKLLLSEGLVTATKESVGRRERTVYSITEEGRAALRQWLSTEARPSSLEFEAIVRVLLADQGDIEDLRTTLRAIAAQALLQREQFVLHAAHIVDTEGGTYPERRHLTALTNRFMIGHFTHIVDWATWALGEVESWPDAVTPADSHWEDSREILATVAALGATLTPDASTEG